MLGEEWALVEPKGHLLCGDNELTSEYTEFPIAVASKISSTVSLIVCLSDSGCSKAVPSGGQAAFHSHSPPSLPGW